MEKKRVIVLLSFIFIFISATVISIIYYSDKYSVLFETGTNDVFLTRYVNKNESISEPLDPTKDGYVFIEWQLNGAKYDFSNKINSDTVLTAKWLKEEYVEVNFDTKTDEKVHSQKILKGNKIENLPLIDSKDFIGWYINDKIYEDQELYDNVVLEAKYRDNIVLKVGDNVIITGKYSSSAYDFDCIYDAAIGWEREILYIFNDGEYPYAVGFDNEVTGFFKSDSIKLFEK